MLQVNKVWLFNAPERPAGRPRPRAYQFFKDLYAYNKTPLCEETLLRGSQYHFTDLCETMFLQLSQENALTDVDLLIFTFWTPEFDPIFSAAGPYFLAKYNIHARMMSISDEGSLDLFTAIKFSQQLVEKNKFSNILVMGLEQTTIPRDLNRKKRIPNVNATFALKLSRSDNDQCYQIIDAGIITAEMLLSGVFNFHTILEKCNNYDTSTLLVCPANSTVDKLLTHYYYKPNFPTLDIHFLEDHPGCYLTYHALDNILNNHIADKHKQNIILMIPDEETLGFGFIIIRQKKYAN
jgi:hypothetical protein